MLESVLNKFYYKQTPTQVFPVKFAKFLRTSFYRTPPVAAAVFCIDFVHISYENLIVILEDSI